VRSTQTATNRPTENTHTIKTRH